MDKGLSCLLHKDARRWSFCLFEKRGEESWSIFLLKYVFVFIQWQLWDLGVSNHLAPKPGACLPASLVALRQLGDGGAVLGGLWIDFPLATVLMMGEPKICC